METKQTVDVRRTEDFDRVEGSHHESWQPKKLKDLLEEDEAPTLQERMENWGSD